MSHIIKLCKNDDEKTILEKTLQVLPSSNQLAWHKKELTIFVHFGMNTYTNREWGVGNEDPQWFNPSHLDADEYVRVCKEAGAQQLILTCKHHDGFCLWPSAYTSHCVKPNMDVVRAFRNACNHYDFPFGIYLSPWDRHEVTYGTGQAYNDFYLNQLKELLTKYGPIEDVWLDGACGEGKNGKIQHYDWQAIFRLIRTYAPKATISSVGPDVRWCGNEAGQTRLAEWNVQPIPLSDGHLAEDSKIAADAFVFHNANFSTRPDLGSLNHLKEASESECYLYWYPAQIDVSIRPGWFYHESENDQVKSASELYDLYMRAVGGNTQLLLNVPMNKDGQMPMQDKQSLLEFGNLLKETFKNDLAEYANKQPLSYGLELEWQESTTFDLISLKEDLTKGQRVAKFKVECATATGWQCIAQGTTIGHRSLIRLSKKCQTKKLRVIVTESRGQYVPIHLQVYVQAETLQPPIIVRNEMGWVSIHASGKGCLYYQIDDGAMIAYKQPFYLNHSARLHVDYRHAKLGNVQVSYHFGELNQNWKINSLDHVEILSGSLNNLVQDSGYVVMQTDCVSIEVDMLEEKVIHGLLIEPISSGEDIVYNLEKVKVAFSIDGKIWSNPVSFSLDNVMHLPNLREFELPNKIRARYFRLYIVQGLSQQAVGLASVNVY